MENTPFLASYFAAFQSSAVHLYEMQQNILHMLEEEVHTNPSWP